MAYTEILTTHGQTVEQWENSIFSEYIGMVWWSHLMGTSTNAIIQIKDDLTKKPGDAINIGLRGLMTGGHVTGTNKGIGNEGSVAFYNQRIVVDNVRHLIKFEDVPMSNQRVMWSILNEGREALMEKSKIQLEDDITSALTTIGSERVQGRYVYGNAAWNATHATALIGIDNTNDQLSTSVIDIAKRKALIPVNATARIRPMRVRIGRAYEEWYASVFHTYCIRDLVNNDAAWRNAQLNLPPQSNRNSVIFTGSSFKGSWNGTLIYEYERLPLISSTIQVSHGLLLGAQAGACVWAQRPRFGEDTEDMGHDVIYETHEIRNEAKMVFDRSTTEDHGLVNVFAAAVAD